jgi:hypothetical protein
MTTIREALIATRELLSDPMRWTRGAVAKRADGQIVDIHDPEACRFCTVGGLNKVTGNEGSLFDECYGALQVTSAAMFPSEADHGEPTDPIDVNDGRGHADVIRMFDLTIERFPA